MLLLDFHGCDEMFSYESIDISSIEIELPTTGRLLTPDVHNKSGDESNAVQVRLFH